jgi:hypothetical protein
MANKKISELSIAATLTGSEVLPIVQSGQTVQTTAQSIADLASGGGGISGTQYVYVTANGTDIENAAELQAAYTTAQGMSPSIINRITVVAAPGNYNFDASQFVMDTEYIDLVSLDGNKSIIFNSSNNLGTINITANDVFVRGIDVQSKNFTIASNLNLLKVENCKGGQYSFGAGLTASGTFTDCIGGDRAFGGYNVVAGTASGTFTRCIGGIFSFGGNGTASGTFTDCVGGNLSFGGNAIASGTFTRCIGGNSSFAGSSAGNASGLFIDCYGPEFCFGGGGGLSSGTFIRCRAITQSFTCTSSTGVFLYCNGSSSCFLGPIVGKLYYCRLSFLTFGNIGTGGIVRLCIDGNNNEINLG